jgi:hypothetical protein
MTHGNDSAYASAPFKYGDDGKPLHIGKQANQGLTKRELIAAMAMQALIQNNDYLNAVVMTQPQHKDTPSRIIVAEHAIIHADALIEALNKEAK